MGRKLLTFTAKIAQENNFNIIMGDTDSIFVDLKVSSSLNCMKESSAQEKISELKFAVMEAKNLLSVLNKEAATHGKVRESLNLGMACKLRIDLENIWASMIVQGKKKYCGLPLKEKDSWLSKVFVKLIKGQDPEVICDEKRAPKYSMIFKGMEATRKDYPVICQKILKNFFEFILEETRTDTENQITNRQILLDQINPFVTKLNLLVSHVWEQLDLDQKIKFFSFSQKKPKSTSVSYNPQKYKG